MYSVSLMLVIESIEVGCATQYILYDDGIMCNARRMIVPPFEIQSLDWDDENDEHIRRHVPPIVVQGMFEANDWIIARNKRHQPAERLRLIGRTIGGDFLTVVLAPTDDSQVWRPVTAYVSEQREVQLFETTKRRQR